MKVQDYERVGMILKYIKDKESEISLTEIVAKFIPSVYDLNIVYNKVLEGKFFRIDSKDKRLKGLIRKAHQLKEDGFNSDERVRYLNEN